MEACINLVKQPYHFPTLVLPSSGSKGLEHSFTLSLSKDSPSVHLQLDSSYHEFNFESTLYSKYYFYRNNERPINQIAGTNNAGNIFNDLLSLIPKMESPELKINIPPTMDTSVINAVVKNGSKY